MIYHSILAIVQKSVAATCSLQETRAASGEVGRSNLAVMSVNRHGTGSINVVYDKMNYCIKHMNTAHNVIIL